MAKESCSEQLCQYFGGCLYFTAGRLYRSVERLAFEAFKPLGLAPTHAFLIMSLRELDQGTATPSELSKSMNLDRSTVTRLLAALEEKKIIKSVSVGRTKEIHLTVKGVALIPDIKKAWSSLYQAYVEEFGEKKANAMNECIRQNMVSREK